MRWARWFVGVFVILISLATWVPAIRIAGIGPDLMLGVVFTLGLVRGPVWGVWTGFVLGLLLGVEDPGALGVDSFALALAGVAAGSLFTELDRSSPLVLLVLLFVCALIAETVRGAWVAWSSAAGFFGYWGGHALPSAVYTTLVLPALGWVTARLLGKRDWLRLAS